MAMIVARRPSIRFRNEEDPTLDAVLQQVTVWKSMEKERNVVLDDLYTVISRTDLTFLFCLFGEDKVLQGVSSLIGFPDGLHLAGFLIHPEKRRHGLGASMFRCIYSFFENANIQELFPYKFIILHTMEKEFWTKTVAEIATLNIINSLDVCEKTRAFLLACLFIQQQDFSYMIYIFKNNK